jgi:hypothetical protein
VNLLAGKLYDPSTAVSKATTAALAMTAIDTTNLRLTFTVPASGIVRVRLGAVVHGATTFPSILLGVLEGSTVRGRLAPVQSLGNTAVATALVQVEADFLVTGLTPGASLSWDAAYGVETLVAATGLKYGGPNNATANDAFGGFFFEIWDPCPDYLPSAVPTSSLDAKLDVIDNLLDTEVAAILAAVDTEVAAIKAKTDNLPTTPAAAGDAMALTAAAVDAIADEVYENGLTLRQIVRLVLAAVAGKADGFPGGPIHYRDNADTKARVTATIDANGNRTVVAVDGT